MNENEAYESGILIAITGAIRQYNVVTVVVVVIVCSRAARTQERPQTSKN